MKSTDRILVQRYARAFDGISHSAEEAQRHYDALCVAEKYLQQAASFMDNPVFSSEQKTAFVAEILQEDKTVSSFVCVLLQAKRYYLLAACVRQVRALLDRRLGWMRAQVQTAFSLTEEQKQRVEAALSRFCAQEAKAEYKVDASLLGGLRVQMGDFLIDGTLKRRFEKLREELTK